MGRKKNELITVKILDPENQEKDLTLQKEIYDYATILLDCGSKEMAYRRLNNLEDEVKVSYNTYKHCYNRITNTDEFKVLYQHLQNKLITDFAITKNFLTKEILGVIEYCNNRNTLNAMNLKLQALDRLSRLYGFENSNVTNVYQPTQIIINEL
jgi:DNA repair ATPase RecN